MTPELMKAAEKLDHMLETMPLSEWTDEVAYDDVKPLVSHILAHREDYDADWTPLEVDEGFVESLGGAECVNRDGAHLMIKADGDALHVIWVRHPMNNEPQLQVVLNGAYSRKSWTRPQLRALIEAMGR